MKCLLRYMWLLLSIFCMQCEKEDEASLPFISSVTPMEAPAGDTVTITGIHFSLNSEANVIKFNGTDAVVSMASDTVIVTTVPEGATTGKISFAVNGVIADWSETFIVLPKGWRRVSGFPGHPFVSDERRATSNGFSIDGKGYIGGFGFSALGSQGYMQPIRKFWMYDPTSNTWNERADFPGEERMGAVIFAIGNKGYIGLGQRITFDNSQQFLKDFWQYDPATDTWSRLEDFGGKARRNAVGFAIGTKGYVGTGTYESGTYAMSDFWEFDPATGHWTQKADYAGNSMTTFGFATSSRGYIGTNEDNSTVSDVFYEYNPATNQWIRKANSPKDLSRPSAFIINSRPFAFDGRSVYEYSVSSDTWTFRTNPRSDSFIDVSQAFSVGDRGYMGFNFAFYSYTPE
jgi:hypothetical protein